MNKLFKEASRKRELFNDDSIMYRPIKIKTEELLQFIGKDADESLKEAAEGIHKMLLRGDAPVGYLLIEIET